MSEVTIHFSKDTEADPSKQVIATVEFGENGMLGMLMCAGSSQEDALAWVIEAMSDRYTKPD